MSVTFTRYNDTWCLSSDTELTIGSTVTVQLRNGTTERRMVGARLGQRNNWFGTNTRRIRYIYAVQNAQHDAVALTPSEQHAESAAPPVLRSFPIENAERLFNMFDNAQGHLRRCVVRVPRAGDEQAIRLERDSTGNLRVLRDRPRAGTSRRHHFGTITRDGRYTARHTIGLLTLTADQRDALQAFAMDPVSRAREHGRRTSQCCFCGQGLTDPRSVEVGYGPICADHYALPWGDRPARTVVTIAAPTGLAARAARIANEADADRELNTSNEEDFVWPPVQRAAATDDQTTITVQC